MSVMDDRESMFSTKFHFLSVFFICLNMLSVKNLGINFSFWGGVGVQDGKVVQEMHLLKAKAGKTCS
jgi:hypothetical protein